MVKITLTKQFFSSLECLYLHIYLKLIGDNQIQSEILLKIYIFIKFFDYFEKVADKKKQVNIQ